MKPRLRIPLLAKMLGWLLLHLLVLALLFGGFIAWQLRIGLDSLLSGSTGERLRSFGEVIARDLREVGAAGHEVFCAATGEDALRAFEKADDFGRPFDVLLFDLDIRSGMGGRETLARIRATHPRVKAIVTTGYVDDTVLENYLEHGFCGVLCKPFRLEHLASAVERLGRGGGEPSN